jgi:hypothetical protein
MSLAEYLSTWTRDSRSTLRQNVSFSSHVQFVKCCYSFQCSSEFIGFGARMSSDIENLDRGIL